VKSAAAAMPRVGLVEMTAEQRTADTSCDCAEHTAAHRIAKQCASGTARDRANRAVPATTAVIIISVVAAIDVMTREGGRWQNSWYGDHCGHGGHGDLIFHVILLHGGYFKSGSPGIGR
jgi:hypothetical protein